MLLILRGIPGCGKSTYAQQWVGSERGRARVNRDDIRKMVFGKDHGVDEYTVTKIERDVLRNLLRQDYDVVIDDCNVTWAYVRAFADIGNEFGMSAKIKVFDVPVEVAIAQNNKRFEKGGRFVPHDVIRKMHQTLEANKHMTLEKHG